MEYPQHAMLKLVQHQSQTIHEFLIWLGEKKIRLATYPTERSVNLHPVNRSHAELAAEFLEIDLKQLENEKLAMIEEMRAGNGG